MLLKQSTAVALLIGPFLDDSDGKTAETALTIAQADVRLSKNGGDMAQKGDATSCTHDELGYYACPLSTTDTGTLGHLKLMVHVAGALPVWAEYMVVPSAVYDAMVLGTDELPADAAGIRTALGMSAADLDTQLGAIKGDTAATLQDTGTDGVVVPQAQADKVWLTVARTLTSGANIALAKGTGLLGLTDLDATAVQTAAAAAITAAALATAANLATVGGKADTLLARVVGTLLAGNHNPQSGDAYARIGAAGAGLTALGDTRLAGLDAAVSSRLAASGYTEPDNAGIAAIAAALATLNDLSPAEVKAVVVQALAGDTYAEPGQEAPPELASLMTMMRWLFKCLVNQSTLDKDAGLHRIFNRAATQVDHKAAVSDDGTTFTRGRIESGP